jgi:hypothetical protein
MNSQLNTIDINLFLEKVLHCLSYIDKIIKKYNTFKANSRSCIGPIHTEFQIISLITFVFINRYIEYSIDDNGKVNSLICLEKTAKKWYDIEQKFKNNVGKRYVMDILSQRWKGSGDKKLDSLLFDSDYYTMEISQLEFENALNHWFFTSNAEKNEYKRFASPQESEKLLLSLIYLPIFSAESHLDGSQYDIEHLAPKGLMKRLLDRYNGDVKLAVSSFANLCLLPQQENRSKRDKTIYSDNQYLQKSKYSLSEIEDKFSFTKIDDLIWLENNILDAEQFKIKFDIFLNERFTKLLKIIMKNFDNI